ncbi:hypothetical protein QE152_g33159 [Popillia japonica]|uniref:Uncharacterized protein n=1 Tax=Popillia japonica TaxID=7064 RepID=A0AAW1IY13_POPJA
MVHTVDFDVSVTHTPVPVTSPRNLDNFSSKDELPLSSFQKPKRKKISKKKTIPLKYDEGAFNHPIVQVQEPEWNVAERTNWTPYKYFCQYFNDEF